MLIKSFFTLGGTARAACYAVTRLGMRLIVANRDEEKGNSLAKQFNGTFLPLDAIASAFSDETKTENIPTVVISTLPGSVNFTLSAFVIQKMATQLLHKPVIMDVVYKPARTALLNQALMNHFLVVQGGSTVVFQNIENLQE